MGENLIFFSITLYIEHICFVNIVYILLENEKEEITLKLNLKCFEHSKSQIAIKIITFVKKKKKSVLKF